MGLTPHAGRDDKNYANGCCRRPLTSQLSFLFYAQLFLCSSYSATIRPPIWLGRKAGFLGKEIQDFPVLYGAAALVGVATSE